MPYGLDPQSLIIWLVIGAIAGWLAGQIMGGGFGLVGNIILGIVGAVVAGWLFPYLGWHFIGNALIAAIVNALIGAIIVLAVLRLLKRA
jgi:uncharacterized membrane protein YeaQ/YmgE (transglycosylase-associated protein family)